MISGRGEVAASRSELVKLAAQLIIEEALEGEVEQGLGREYYARGSGDGGQRNGYRRGSTRAKVASSSRCRKSAVLPVGRVRFETR